MNNKRYPQSIPLSDAIRRFGRRQPQNYRIVVLGALDSVWSDRLAGLRVESQCASAADPIVTVLHGLIQDQAQLSGVLNTLSDLHLPLLSVELTEECQI